MASRLRSWQYVTDLADGAALPDGRGLDVLLVQEALPPPGPVRWRVFPDPTDPSHWRTTAPAIRMFTTAILVFTPAVQIEMVPVVALNDCGNTHGDYLASSHPGAFRAIQVTADGRSVILISAYGLQDDKNPTKSFGSTYALTTLHRMFSDLTPLLDSDRGQRVVVGGDLNAGTQLWQGEKYDSWSLTLWQRIQEFGFTDCLPAMVAADRGGLPGCACGGGADCRHTLTSRVNREQRAPVGERPHPRHAGHQSGRVHRVERAGFHCMDLQRPLPRRRRPSTLTPWVWRSSNRTFALAAAKKYKFPQP